MKILSILFLLLVIWFPQAHAFDLESSPYLTGDWGGARTSLSHRGIDFTIGYVSETAHNYSGGTRQLTDYTDQYTFGADFDFEKLGFWKGAQAAVYVTDRNGHNLGADAAINNDMLIQEVYGRGQTWHMTRFWLNQKLWDNRLEVKFGRLTVGEDFASFDCDFQNLTFCGAPPGNLVGGYWLNWPTSVWAARLKYHMTSEMFWQIGAYEDNPNYVNDRWASRYGWTLDDPNGAVGTLIPAEFDWTPTLNGRKGTYRIGAWYDTALSMDLGNPDLKAARYGVYLNVQQQISGSKDTPGFTVFFNATQADRTTAAIDRQLALGTEYHGPFKRMQDAVGFALGATNNNSRYANYMLVHNKQTGQTILVGDRDEFAAELFYGYSPIASLTLRPNVQYVIQPGGVASNPDAFVLGLKAVAAF